MQEQPTHHASTLALNTKVETDFVAPLTAVRSALEILRDFPDLGDDDRRRFVESALRGCARLEHGIEQLSESVYAAGEGAAAPAQDDPLADDDPEYRKRIRVLDDQETIEVDLSDCQFSNSQIVNAFHDVIDHAVEPTRRRWYFLVNFRNCRVWPEAWIAFAHRGKKINVSYSLGTVRYADVDPEDADARSTQLGVSDPDFFESRDAALARIEELKRSAKH